MTMETKRSRKALLWVAVAALLSLNVLIPVASTDSLEHQKKHQDEIIRCKKEERVALSKFKTDVVDHYKELSTWNETEECCRWKGVVCSNTTDHVVALHLHNLVMNIDLNPALHELTHLSLLDLSDNYFWGARIPEFIGSMEQLEELNLRNSGYTGEIPPQIGNLTNLRTLDLSKNSFDGIRIPSFIGSMKKLQHLNLGSCKFSGMIPPQLWNLTNLKTLDLSSNSFSRIRIPNLIGSMKKLQHLNLKSCKFSGMIPPQLGNLTNLRLLDLSDNFLWSENLNWLSSLSHLSQLNLDSSNLSDTNWLKPIMMLRSLQELNLNNCSIPDFVPFPGLFANSSSTSLSVLNLAHNNLITYHAYNVSTSLVRLDLSHNKLTGPIPHSFGRMVNLEVLDLSANKLQGSVPELGACPALREVYFSGNNLTGPLPSSLGNLLNLQNLDVSSNSLEGTVTEAYIMNLHELKVLDLSFNSLTVQIAPFPCPIVGSDNACFQLQNINLAGCNIGQHFPEWIRYQSHLQSLDLSDAGISGEVPKWLWSFSPQLRFLNISFNHINGTLPDLLSPPFLFGIDARSNKLSGPIPLFSSIISVVMLSQNMFSGPISSICEKGASLISAGFLFLDLSNNLLVGQLPNCWKKTPNIQYLNLANNTFTGELPHSLGNLQDLRTLHLRGNILSGKMPPTLSNCQQLRLIDIGGNNLTGDISWIIAANYSYVNYLMLGDNRFYGSIPPEICHCTRLQILDLSGNNFSGKIPHCFNNFTAISGNYTDVPFVGALYDDLFDRYSIQGPHNSPGHDFNYERVIVHWKGQVQEYARKRMGLVKLIDLSGNRLVGSIPTSFSDLKGLISLNLSRNSLRGNIIPGVGEMVALETLDLSRNQLSGTIPVGLAQLHFLSFLDLANNNLSGQIPLGTQLQSFDPSAYSGNNGLCGRPLPLCLNTPNIEPKESSNKIGLSSRQELFISVFMGFFVGFWGVVGSLVLKRSWRSAYFNLSNVVGDWFFVNTSLFLSKFRRS